MSREIKLAYFGSPNFSALFLEKLLTDVNLKNILRVEFVVSQPDKPVGRKQIITPTPVKQVAKNYKIPVYYFKNPNLETLLKNLDLVLVYAFAQIIPKKFLNLPRLGFWCLHPSLLPKYRGPSPIAFSLLTGEKKTGITIFKMDEKIDHGSIIVQKSTTIENTDYRIDLEKKLTDLGFNCFKKICLKISQSPQSISLPLKNQNHQKATYTQFLKKDDGFISFQLLKKIINHQPLPKKELPNLIKNLNKKRKSSSEKIYDFFRGLTPWPAVWTILPNNKRLKILDLTINPVNKEIVIKKVQMEGKKPVDFQTFKQAYRFF